MRLIEGKQYGDYTYRHLWQHDTNYNCDVCHKVRSRHHIFYRTANPDDTLMIGTECIKGDNFYTRLLGISNIDFKTIEEAFRALGLEYKDRIV